MNDGITTRQVVSCVAGILIRRKKILGEESDGLEAAYVLGYDEEKKRE